MHFLGSFSLWEDSLTPPGSGPQPSGEGPLLGSHPTPTLQARLPLGVAAAGSPSPLPSPGARRREPRSHVPRGFRISSPP